MNGDRQFPSTFQRLLSPQSLWRAARNRLWSRRELCFYLYAAKELGDRSGTVPFRRDSFADLEAYERTDPHQLTPDDFRRESQRRIAQGNHLYTHIQAGILVFYGWLVDRQERSEDPLMGQVFFPPADASVIFDCFVHPSARRHGLYTQAVRHMIAEAREVARAQQVCMGVFADNPVSRHVVTKVGFRYIGSMIKERRLWYVKRYAVPVAPEFRTALLSTNETGHGN